MGHQDSGSCAVDQIGQLVCVEKGQCLLERERLVLLQRLILGSTMRAWPAFPSALAHHDQVRRDSDPNPKRQRGKPPGFWRHGRNAAENLAGASGSCVASRSNADATVRRLPEVMVEISVKSRIFGAVAPCQPQRLVLREHYSVWNVQSPGGARDQAQSDQPRRSSRRVVIRRKGIGYAASSSASRDHDHKHEHTPTAIINVRMVKVGRCKAVVSVTWVAAGPVARGATAGRWLRGTSIQVFGNTLAIHRSVRHRSSRA